MTYLEEIAHLQYFLEIKDLYFLEIKDSHFSRYDSVMQRAIINV